MKDDAILLLDESLSAGNGCTQGPVG